jgi:ribosomal protein L7/L12
MYQVVLTGWHHGLKKVSLDKLLSKLGKLSLPEAKKAVDELLDGKQVVVEMASLTAAAHLLAEARSLGAIGEVRSPLNQ